MSKIPPMTAEERERLDAEAEERRLASLFTEPERKQVLDILQQELPAELAKQLWDQLLPIVDTCLARHSYEAYTRGQINGTLYPWKD